MGAFARVGMCNRICFTEDEQHMVVATGRGTVQVMDLASSDVVALLEPPAQSTAGEQARMHMDDDDEDSDDGERAMAPLVSLAVSTDAQVNANASTQRR